MTAAQLSDNLTRVQETIARIQAREGLSGPVRIVVVTKGHPAQVVREALAVGLSDVGENRVQEAVAKQAEVADVTARWHLIGHLQTNKAKFVPDCFVMVHSLDSLRVTDALEGALDRAEAHRLDALVQVNLAGEEQKSGCAPAEAAAIAHHVAGRQHLRLRGLMTIAPFTDDVRVQRATFAKLRELRDRLTDEGLTVPELSMGMSGDYEAAVSEGATIVRLGTVLLGERPT